ncbi:hypothetical protein KFK09_029201 [Dendrobium nobile]|uniref:Kinetochore protein Nuf2 N-terminal domain-containing protein n=1 Tax=Dendrobium nobile TaxID=94219 RepID=A0A8T3A5L5_DENNO|nr:hypothetical protein KFK09_029201 [Dendrobium nobile]
MSSTFHCPEMPASQIAEVLTDSGIATVSEEDLAAPTAELAFALYASVLNYFQPLSEDVNGGLDFGALQLLDNPEHHEDAVRAINLYHRMNELLVSINCNGFKLSDLLRPEARRIVVIFSAIVNFLYYREEKLATLQVFMDKLPACDERKSELEEKLAELKKQSMDYDVARKEEEPLVHEVDAEVNKLKHSIQDYNKQQMLMRNQAKELKEKADAIDSKISQADFELLKKAEENSKLLSEVVQSPDKLQRALEEKRNKLAEVKNSERLAIQSVQEKNTAIEVYLKASEKMSKLSSLVQATQEEMNSAKNIEKDLKALKVKLSNDAVSDMSLEAKVFELQGKVKQADELLRTTEKERHLRLAEDIQKLNNARAEVEHVLKCLEPRERKLEDMVARSDSLCQEADSVREAEKLKQQKLLSKLEEIVHLFHSHSNRTNNFLEIFRTELISKDNIHLM